MTVQTGANLLEQLESGYALPTLSVIAIKLVDLASDENCSINELEALIEKDPSLAVRLLKLANSAFFRGNQPAATLRQAILRIGFRQLRIMALSLSLRDTFPMGRIGLLDYERFWHTSLYRALIAKSLAQHLKTCNPEEAFVAGLTLGTGFLIFFDIFLKGKQMDAHPELDTLEKLLDWERQGFGVDHRQIGEVALRYWKFPEKIIDCQRGYFKEENLPPLAQVCESARILSHVLLQRSADFHALFEEGKESFGLDENTINDIIVRTFDEVQEIADSLKLDMDKDKDLFALMEKANRALSHISEKISSLRYDQPLPSFEALAEQEEGHAFIMETLQAVAHEIRNPLVAVAGFAKKLAATVDPQSKGGQYARIILDEARRLESALTEMTTDGPPRETR
jgi:HD-like signal output (HDOD) protein